MELRSHKWVFHVFVMIDLVVWMNLRNSGQVRKFVPCSLLSLELQTLSLKMPECPARPDLDYCSIRMRKGTIIISGPGILFLYKQAENEGKNE